MFKSELVETCLGQTFRYKTHLGTTGVQACFVANMFSHTLNVHPLRPRGHEAGAMRGPRGQLKKSKLDQGGSEPAKKGGT